VACDQKKHTEKLIPNPNFWDDKVWS